MNKEKAERINKAMQVLEKHFKFNQRTTLNMMRQEKVGKIKNKNAFKILIACLLSLRARDEATEKISKKLFKIADTPEKLAGMELKKLKKIIYSSGHYNKKARTLKHVSREMIKRFRGKVPDNEQALLSIKGIGRKTANIVLNFAFGKLVIPVDTNVHRVSNRLGWVDTKNPEETERELMKVLPKKYWMEINGVFILHGRNICVPISPKCSICPVNSYCPKKGVIKQR